MILFKYEQALLNEYSKINKITKISSVIRLLLAIAFLVFTICLLTTEEYITYSILSGLFLLLFISFVIVTNKYYKQLIQLGKKKDVYTIHKLRRDKKTNTFYDTGQEFLDINDYKQSDLDIFGKKSLYQYLVSAKTAIGRKKLAKQLINPEPKPRGFTECINRMSTTEDVLNIEASLHTISSGAKKADYSEFVSVAGNKIQLKFKHFIPLICYVFELIYLILVIALGLNPYILFVFLMLNFGLSKLCLKNDIFKLNATAYYNLCDSYLEISKTILDVKIEDEYFENIQNNIKQELDGVRKLRSLYSSLALRKNAIFNMGLNALAILDFWMLLIFNYHSNKVVGINKIFDLVAEVEVMLSFANIGIDNDVYSIPEEANEITAVDIYHPLLVNCIANSITFNGGIVLTGSNMSGKTTFMRTLGINQLLYNAGSIICAVSYKAPKMPVYTSLRANDMLIEGVSTFYAEILRMQLMQKAIEQGQCLILVDEIFKGTNAQERITASKMVIDKFNSHNVFFIISTHDFELCDANNIENYHFSEAYIEDKISFNYLLKKGKCETTNALYLLKIANII